jgi:hypothetical protein
VTGRTEGSYLLLFLPSCWWADVFRTPFSYVRNAELFLGLSSFPEVIGFALSSVTSLVSTFVSVVASFGREVEAGLGSMVSTGRADIVVWILCAMRPVCAGVYQDRIDCCLQSETEEPCKNRL